MPVDNTDKFFQPVIQPSQPVFDPADSLPCSLPSSYRYNKPSDYLQNQFYQRLYNHRFPSIFLSGYSFPTHFSLPYRLDSFLVLYNRTRSGWTKIRWTYQFSDMPFHRPESLR